MERRFGREFSSVRIHVRDPGRAGLAPDAAACTAGTDIVIAPGLYTPATRSGRTLLAHELAHVVQQSGRPGQGGTVSADLAERQAVAAGNAVASGAPVPALGTVVARTRQFAPVRPSAARTKELPDHPAFPFTATLVTDEVALRSSPSGRIPGREFHNLVASLRNDVRLMVMSGAGRWMQVRVISGTALDGRTNKPVSASGLTGYVSEELLVMGQTIPARESYLDPAAYSSFEDYSADWPDKVTSVEHIRQVWADRSKKAWTDRALAAAGIDPKLWEPMAGFRKNKQVFFKVYAYYESLYLADNRLKWAAMAKLAGGEVYRGYRDNILPSIDFGAFLNDVGGDKDDYTLMNLAGDLYQIYAGTLDIRLLQMQKAIFMDLAWQHQAFREGGIAALAASHARGELSAELFKAWQDIDSGKVGNVNAGNMELLRREQFEILQGGSSGQGFYKQIQDIPDNDEIPKTMSEEAQSPIPGGKKFMDVIPGGDITKFEDRWKWLQQDMIPAFEGLNPETLTRLVQKSLPELADKKF